MKTLSELIRTTSLLIAGAAASVAFAATGPNVVTNGDFESGWTGWTEINPDGHGRLNYQDRAARNPSTDEAGNNNNYGLQTWTGAYASPEADSAEGIYQDIGGLTIGHRYSLSFFTTGSDFRWAGENQYWRVNFGFEAQNGNEFSPPPDPDNYLWTQNWTRTSADGVSINANFRWIRTNLTFTATRASQRLGFHQAQSLDSPWDTSVAPYATPAILLIDGISLRDIDFTPPVPEPTAASLSLIGLTLVGFVATRRRKPRD